MCLYSPHKAECAKVQLLDTVIMDGTEIAAYLFTSREGAVKKKSKRQLGRGRPPCECDSWPARRGHAVASLA